MLKRKHALKFRLAKIDDKPASFATEGHLIFIYLLSFISVTYTFIHFNKRAHTDTHKAS
jgi:hypothetical protein